MILKSGVKVKLNPHKFQNPDLFYGVGIVRCWIKPQSEPNSDNGYWSIDFDRLDSHLAENLWLQEDEVIPLITGKADD